MFRIASLICFSALLSGCLAGMGYGSAGVISGAGANSNAQQGSLARANVGTYNIGNSAGYGQNTGTYSAPVVYSTNMDSGSDDSDSYDGSSNLGSSNFGAGVLSGASSSSASQGGFSGSRVGAFRVGGSGFGNAGNVQVIQVDSSSVQDLNSQIQNTIQGILRKFGITMQQSFNAANSGLYQPGRTFVVGSNGIPTYQTGGLQYGLNSGDLSQSQSQSQNQYQGGQQQSQVQYQGQIQQPVMVSYKIIGTPGQSNAGLAFSVVNQGDRFGSAAGAGSSASASNVNAGYSGAGHITGLYDNSNSAAVQQAAAATDSDDNQDDSNYSSAPVAAGNNYGASVPVPVVVPKPAASSYGGSSYSAPVVAQPVRNQVRYAANSNKKSESSANVAYEQDSS